jgi:D-aminopeptidase
VTAEHPASSYGIPVLVVGGDVVLQVPLTKEEPEQHAAMVRVAIQQGAR